MQRHYKEERVLRPASSLLAWQAPAVLIASSVSSSFRGQWPAAPRDQQLLPIHPFLGQFYNRVPPVRYFPMNSIPRHPRRQVLASFTVLPEHYSDFPEIQWPQPCPPPQGLHLSPGDMGHFLVLSSSAWGLVTAPYLLFLSVLFLPANPSLF